MIDRVSLMKDSNIKKFNVNFIKGICPNKCVWCFVPWIEKKSYLSLETMKSFIDLNKDEKIFFDSMGFGEPLWHPQFYEMMELIRSNKNITLGMIATSLNTKELRNIDQLKYFDLVIIEFGGMTEKTKYKNMGFHKAEFERNMEYLLSTNPKNTICLKMLVNKNNYKEKEQLEKYTKKINLPNVIFDINYVDIHSDEYLDFFIKDSLTSKERNEFSYNYFYNKNNDKNFNREKDEYIIGLENRSEKHREGFFHCLLDCDGYGYMCHISFGIKDDEKRHSYSIGNYSKESIKEIESKIENSEVYKKMMKTELFDFCKQCHIF